jgi:hypothetical protein
VEAAIGIEPGEATPAASSQTTPQLEQAKGRRDHPGTAGNSGRKTGGNGEDSLETPEGLVPSSSKIGPPGETN